MPQTSDTDVFAYKLRKFLEVREEREQRSAQLLYELCEKIEQTSGRDATIYIQSNQKLREWFNEHKEYLKNLTANSEKNVFFRNK